MTISFINVMNGCVPKRDLNNTENIWTENPQRCSFVGIWMSKSTLAYG